MFIYIYIYIYNTLLKSLKYTKIAYSGGFCLFVGITYLEYIRAIFRARYGKAPHKRTGPG